MSDEQWVPDEQWAAAVGDLPPRSGEPCSHAYVHHMDTVIVGGAALCAVRCSQCGTILATGSNG